MMWYVNVPADYSRQLAVHHSSGNHVWTQSPNIPLTDWLDNDQGSREWLEKQLNSAEDLDATEGEFYVEMMFIKNSGCGGKNGGKKGNPGRMSYEKLQRGCIIQIKNKDELCCARAIVTLKTRVDKDPEYRNIMQGCGVQGFYAGKLHHKAGVAEGLCGRDELKKFQEFLGADYQVIVFEGLGGTIVFKDKQYDQATNVLTLLKVENHYHAVTRTPALLNRSYFCRHCEKGYDHETAKQHNCMGQNCRACHRDSEACPNFVTWVTREV